MLTLPPSPMSMSMCAVWQLCDPNDDHPVHPHTTGVVAEAIRDFWRSMKNAHWLDARTRAVTITLPVRANHDGIRMRLSMMFQTTSNAGVLPSYDIESVVDNSDVGFEEAMKLLLATTVLVSYFLAIELFEIRREGVHIYFANMWNLMDWLGFLLFFLTFDAYRKLGIALGEDSCGDDAVICTGVGYHDDWEVFTATKSCKMFLSISSTLQLLKTIKFINVFVPKMALATSVLSHGLADLAMFTIFFIFTIFAFGQMFFIQLGFLSESFVAQWDSAFSLFRALFGDFDIQLIMDSSPTYSNSMFFVAYLFTAIFIFLSIFLTILGEHQTFVREEELNAKLNGTAPPEFGVLHTGRVWVTGKVRKLGGELRRRHRGGDAAQDKAPKEAKISVEAALAKANHADACANGHVSSIAGGGSSCTASAGGSPDADRAGLHLDLDGVNAALAAKNAAHSDGAAAGGAGVSAAEFRALLEGQAELARELRELREAMAATEGKLSAAGAGAGAGASAGGAGTGGGVDGSARQRSTLESSAVQLSLATLRATQAARQANGAGVEQHLLTLRTKQDEQGEILRTILRQGQSGRSGHRSHRSGSSRLEGGGGGGGDGSSERSRSPSPTNALAPTTSERGGGGGGGGSRGVRRAHTHTGGLGHSRGSSRAAASDTRSYAVEPQPRRFMS